MTDLRTAAKEALEALYEETAWFGPTPKGAAAIAALKAALAQQDEPAQEQDVEDAIEAVYWHFDARKKGLNEWAYAPQSERDAFKAEARKLVRGYFPTRQAQDTKREMLAVADAFIRGKRSAQEQAEPDHETRTEIAEQRVVQLAEERDHYRNLWQKAQQAEPEQGPVAWMFTDREGTEFFEQREDWDGWWTPLYTAPPQRKPLTEEPAQKQVTYSTGGLHLEAGFYSEVDLRRMLKALESMNAAARRAMEETK